MLANAKMMRIKRRQADQQDDSDNQCLFKDEKENFDAFYYKFHESRKR